MPKEIIKKFQDKYGKKKGKEVYYATANKQDRNPETFEKKDDYEKQSANAEIDAAVLAKLLENIPQADLSDMNPDDIQYMDEQGDRPWLEHEDAWERFENAAAEAGMPITTPDVYPHWLNAYKRQYGMHDGWPNSENLTMDKQSHVKIAKVLFKLAAVCGKSKKAKRTKAGMRPKPAKAIKKALARKVAANKVANKLLGVSKAAEQTKDDTVISKLLEKLSQ